MISLRNLLRSPGIAAFAFLFLLAACDSVEDRVQGHYDNGQELVAAGSEDKAVLEFRNALQLNSDHAPSHFALGLMAEARGDLTGAFGRFRRVAEIDQSHHQARIKLARFNVLGGNLEEAEKLYEEVNALDPNHKDTHILRGAISIRQDDLKTAREAIDAAFAIDPNSTDAALLDVNYLLKTSTEAAALTRADEALRNDPASFVLNTVKLQILQRLGDQPAIGDHLAAMIGHFPDELRLLELQAQWAIQQGEVATAEKALRGLVAAQPKKQASAFDLIRYVQAQRGEGAGREELYRLIADAEDPFSLRLMLAQYEENTGHPEVAFELLRDLVTTSDVSKANEARVALARALIKNGKRDEGLVVVQETLEIDSKEVEAMVIWAAHLFEQDQLDEAQVVLRSALNEAPEDVRLLLLSGQLQERLGNIDLASDRMAKAVRLRDYDPQVIQSYVQLLSRIGRDQAVETVLAETNRRFPNNERILDQLGFVRAKLEDWSGAERIARLLSQTNPDRARQLRAAILIGQERFDEGASLLRNLPEDERQRAASVAALVQTYIRNGETAEAATFLDNLLAENPDNLQALGLRGNLYLANGERDKAAATYQSILNVDPGNAGASSALARMYQMAGDEALAEQALLSGLEINPENVFLKTRLAQFRELQGKFDSAIQLYTDVYKQVPNSLLITNNLSSLLADHRASDLDEVDRAYQLASRLRDSAFPHYRDTYGWTRYLRGEYEEALSYIRPVADELPQNAWVHYHLGKVYLALNQTKDARTHLQLSLDLSENIDFPPKDEVIATIEKLKES